MNKDADCKEANGTPLAQADFDAVLAFLPAFEAEGFQAADWLHYEACQPPFLAHRGVVAKFIQALYDHHWILPDFDWAAWGNEKAMTRDAWRAYIPTAPLEDIRELLTAHVRNDRFCEGHLAGVFESGEMVAILRRIDMTARTTIQSTTFSEEMNR